MERDVARVAQLDAAELQTAAARLASAGTGAGLADELVADGSAWAVMEAIAWADDPNGLGVYPSVLELIASDAAVALVATFADNDAWLRLVEHVSGGPVAKELNTIMFKRAVAFLTGEARELTLRLESTGHLAALARQVLQHDPELAIGRKVGAEVLARQLGLDAEAPRLANRVIGVNEHIVLADTAVSELVAHPGHVARYIKRKGGAVLAERLASSEFGAAIVRDAAAAGSVAGDAAELAALAQQLAATDEGAALAGAIAGADDGASIIETLTGGQADADLAALAVYLHALRLLGVVGATTMSAAASVVLVSVAEAIS